MRKKHAMFICAIIICVVHIVSGNFSALPGGAPTADTFMAPYTSAASVEARRAMRIKRNPTDKTIRRLRNQMTPQAAQ